MSIESSAEHLVHIRIENNESLKERSLIRAVNDAAFGGPAEAQLVDRLYEDQHALLSLVAEVDGSLVGHILFSRMWIGTSAGLVSAVALAPVAVLPAYQRRQIGSRLIFRGLDLLRDRGEKVVIVVGHHNYYPRFGFSTEKAKSIGSPFPREAFMAMELTAGALDGIQGSVVYPPAFEL